MNDHFQKSYSNALLSCPNNLVNLDVSNTSWRLELFKVQAKSKLINQMEQDRTELETKIN